MKAPTRAITHTPTPPPSVLARDLQAVTFYDSHGSFVGVRRPGSGKAISVEGLSITVDDVVGSTGLELKADPGVPMVYAGYGALMVTTLVSYLSHSQVCDARPLRDKRSAEGLVPAAINICLPTIRILAFVGGIKTACSAFCGVEG